MKRLTLERATTCTRSIYCTDPNRFISVLRLLNKTKFPRRYISSITKKQKYGIEWIKRRLVNGVIIALVIKFSRSIVPLTVLKYSFSKPFIWCPNETFVSKIIGFIDNLILDIKEHNISIQMLPDWVNDHYEDCRCIGAWVADNFHDYDPGVEFLCDGTLSFKVSTYHAPGRFEISVEAKDFVLYIHSMRINVNIKV